MQEFCRHVIQYRLLHSEFVELLISVLLSLVVLILMIISSTDNDEQPNNKDCSPGE